MKTKLRDVKHGETFLTTSQHNYGLYLFELTSRNTRSQVCCLNLFTNEVEWLFYLDIDSIDTLVYCVHDSSTVHDLIELYDR